MMARFNMILDDEVKKELQIFKVTNGCKDMNEAMKLILKKLKEAPGN